MATNDYRGNPEYRNRLLQHLTNIAPGVAAGINTRSQQDPYYAQNSLSDLETQIEQRDPVGLETVMQQSGYQGPAKYPGMQTGDIRGPLGQPPAAPGMPGAPGVPGAPAPVGAPASAAIDPNRVNYDQALAKSLESQRAQESAILDRFGSQRQGELAQARGNLASRGGLDAGAAERLQSRSLQDMMLGKQGVRQEGMLGRLGLEAGFGEKQALADVDSYRFNKQLEFSNKLADLIGRGGSSGVGGLFNPTSPMQSPFSWLQNPAGQFFGGEKSPLGWAANPIGQGMGSVGDSVKRTFGF